MSNFDQRPAHDRPLAITGLTSYRYRGRYGWIMIGARDHDDAVREAARSFSDGRTVATIENLQVWDGDEYVPVEDYDCYGDWDHDGART